MVLQAAALEHEGMRTATWDSHVIGFLFVYTFSMYVLYSTFAVQPPSPPLTFHAAVAPILYRLASSTYFNLSILSSDFYGLCFGACIQIGFLSKLTRLTGIGLYVSSDTLY
jgi:solute carrier family 35, member F1/2